MSPLDAVLRTQLLDDFSQQVLTGALRVVSDSENPIRLNLFAAAVRELFGHTLHTLAPDERVKKCSWYVPEPNTKGPTRKQRAKYATQGGLSDDFIAEAGIDVKHLHDTAIAAIDELSKYTHVRPGSIITTQEEIDGFVEKALSALVGLFASFDDCRQEVLRAIYDHIDNEVVNAFIREVLQDIDVLSTHHSIEYVWIDNLAITSLTDDEVHFVVTGKLGVELQWGSDSDFHRGDGAKMTQSFPFEVKMWSPVDGVTDFTDVEHRVDTRSWYSEDY